MIPKKIFWPLKMKNNLNFGFQKIEKCYILLLRRMYCKCNTWNVLSLVAMLEHGKRWPPPHLTSTVPMLCHDMITTVPGMQCVTRSKNQGSGGGSGLISFIVLRFIETSFYGSAKMTRHFGGWHRGSVVWDDFCSFGLRKPGLRLIMSWRCEERQNLRVDW